MFSLYTGFPVTVNNYLFAFVSGEHLELLKRKQLLECWQFGCSPHTKAIIIYYTKQLTKSFLFIIDFIHNFKDFQMN
jgi:hypothetical protein